MGDSKFALDYRMVCRTCLQSNVEMVDLSLFIIDDVEDEISKISYMECLKTCIPFDENLDIEMPQTICLECASALQVSYWFTKNASQAQELLKLKLTEIKQKIIQIKLEDAESVKKYKRYRCKICNVKVETKRSLKEHVKLHLDIIVYICQQCSYESHNRNSLCDHYSQIHGVEATRDQLKPRTKLSNSTPSTSKFSENDCMDGAIKSENFQILPEEPQQITFEKCTKPKSAMDSLSDVSMLQVSTMITKPSSSYETVTAQFNTMSEEVNNDFSLGNEFVVMPDGSLEKVINEGVVIEYIDTPNNSCNLTLDNALDLDNIIQVQNMNNPLMVQQHHDFGQMDVDDLIIEDTGDIIEDTQVQENIILPLEEETILATYIEQQKTIMCKICTKDFLTQEQLKNHMLTHNEIPHFFCDQCKFYTFFKIDLHQHYKSKHNLQPTNKQLQPKNKQKTINEIYACDLCFYEAEAKSDIKKHYKIKHNIEANEIHLKPTKVGKVKSRLSPLSAKSKAAAIVSKTTVPSTTKNVKIRSAEPSGPDYPNGLHCRKCHEVFYWRKELYEHYKMHNAEETALKQEKQLPKIQNQTTSLNRCRNKAKTTKRSLAETSKITQTQVETTNTLNFSSLGTLPLNVSTANISTLSSVAPLTPSSSSTYTLPLDAIPQIVETDQTIENVMDFAFSCDDDALFGDFDDDVDVENVSEENDSEFRNILLTSDDDFEDMLQVQNDVETTGSFCAHCQKTFLSQYQFENHMFVHRGLAPYRCEMCTNLYNTKRCLIRHYRAIHKNIPTRDMIQAKGDRACDDKTPVEHLKLEETTCLMCAKCPYECTELNDLKSHLESSHNLNDESFIIKKLPFECPRCIRSFSSKTKLLRHLERNHSLTPINQILSSNEKNAMEIVNSTAATSITTTINNHVNMMNTENIETNASRGKINKVNTTASTTTKFFITNPMQSANINNYNNNHNNPINSS